MQQKSQQVGAHNQPDSKPRLTDNAAKELWIEQSRRNIAKIGAANVNKQAKHSSNTAAAMYSQQT